MLKLKGFIIAPILIWGIVGGIFSLAIIGGYAFYKHISSKPNAIKPSSATLVTQVNPVDLLGVAKKFYLDVGSKNYHEAWGLLSKNFQNQAGDYNNFVVGYKTNLNETLVDTHIKDASQNIIVVKIEADDNIKGEVQHKSYYGTWKLVQEDNNWKLDTADIQLINTVSSKASLSDYSSNSDQIVSCGPFPRSGLTLMLNASVCQNYVDCEYPINTWSPKRKGDCTALQVNSSNSGLQIPQSQNPSPSQTTIPIFDPIVMVLHTSPDVPTFGASFNVDVSQNPGLYIDTRVQLKSCNGYIKLPTGSSLQIPSMSVNGTSCSGTVTISDPSAKSGESTIYVNVTSIYDQTITLNTTIYFP